MTLLVLCSQPKACSFSDVDVATVWLSTVVFGERLGAVHYFTSIATPRVLLYRTLACHIIPRREVTLLA